MTKKTLNIVYGLIGIIISYLTIERLYQEGAFGNDARILAEPIGLFEGLLILFASLLLIMGQLLTFLNYTSGIWFSRISFVFTLTLLVIIYFINERFFIWSYLIDFIAFSIFSLLFYLPVLINKKKEF